MKFIDFVDVVRKLGHDYLKYKNLYTKLVLNYDLYEERLSESVAQLKTEEDAIKFADKEIGQ